MSIYDFDRDDFWNIEKLVPKKKHNSEPFVSRNVTHEYEIKGEGSTDRSENKLIFDEYKTNDKTETVTYEMTDGGLIKSVTIRRFVDKYDFYGNFRKAALLYFDYKTDKCNFAPYYSYMPQYSQLNDEQKNYYFYWRYEFRNSRIIKSDYSYIYLFAYEILNLPDKIPPSEGILLLTRLWREYRKELPRIDSYFLSWVQDYCLVHRLNLPLSEVRDFVFSALQQTSFKEFYISDFGRDGDINVDLMTAYLSDYDWRRGKYASDGKDEKYKTLMEGALSRFISVIVKEYNSLRDINTTKISRTAFPHSLCTHSVKCDLVIEYYPISRDDKLRTLVTMGVRYTENKLRAIYGIKSRLAIKDFPDEYKRLIDSYFEQIAASEQKRISRENIPEYERHYDAPSGEISFAMADEIEKLSWENTYKLVDESDEDVDTPATEPLVIEASTYEAPIPMVNETQDDEGYGLSDYDIENIKNALSGCMTDDASADRINEAFADSFGDVILEMSDIGYTVIEDYKEDVEEWLRKVTR